MVLLERAATAETRTQSSGRMRSMLNGWSAQEIDRQETDDQLFEVVDELEQRSLQSAQTSRNQ
jgi:hypothetical protein